MRRDRSDDGTSWADPQEARLSAEAVLNSVQQPLLILTGDLRLQSANPAFYRTFQVAPAECEGRFVYELGNGQWKIRRLRELLERVLPESEAFDGFEVEHDFEQIGCRVMLLNARRIEHHELILLAVDDVTEQRRAAAALCESETRFRVLVEAEAQAVWEGDAHGAQVTDSPSWRAYTGQSYEEMIGDGWLNAVHPDDRPSAERDWRDGVAAGRIIRSEFRLRGPGGDWRWTSIRAAPIRDAHGTIIKWVGMNVDISARKKAEADRELLLGELNHRFKNLFAVIRALVSQRTRAKTVEDYREALLSRLDALVRAHKLVFEGDWRPIALRALAEQILEPYTAEHCGAIEIGGDMVEIEPRQAVSLCLVLHELTTNAIKYGALSAPNGRIRLSWHRSEDDGRVYIQWDERGGPLVSAPRERGFGTMMIERSFEFDLEGEVEITFRPKGLHLAGSFSLPPIAGNGQRGDE